MIVEDIAFPNLLRSERRLRSSPVKFGGSGQIDDESPDDALTIADRDLKSGGQGPVCTSLRSNLFSHRRHSFPSFAARPSQFSRDLETHLLKLTTPRRGRTTWLREMIHGHLASRKTTKVPLFLRVPRKVRWE